MRIVTHLISLERLGGVEVNTLEDVRALSARGHEVHVLFGSPMNAETGPEIRQELEAAGVVLHGPVPFTTTLQAAAAAVVRFLPAAKLVARLNPDVIWLQRPEQIVWGQTISRRSRTPLVTHLHHMPNYVRAIPFLYRGVTRFLAVSEFMAERWVSAGLPAERVEVLLNAVPPTAYPRGGVDERRIARQRLGLPPDVSIGLYYGRLEEGKGLGVLLDAWDLLDLAPAAGHLVLAGDSPPYADPTLRHRIDALVARGMATLLPNQGDVTPLLHAADLVLFPSLLEEAFGRVALEGLITERPVLGSAIGAVPEILAGPLARLLVPPGNPVAWAAGIGELLTWRTTEPGLGLLCRRHAESAFSHDAHVVRLEQLLHAAAHSRGWRNRRHRPDTAVT